MRRAKGKTVTLVVVCLVLFALLPGIINGEKEKSDIGDRIAILYPDDAEVSARILAKYLDLKHLLPYYALIAEQEQFESAKLRLESAEKAAKYAKRDLDESLRGRPVVAAGVMEAPEETPPPLDNEPDAPAPRPVVRPTVLPDRLPPTQITIHPYRLTEAAPEIAKHFAKEELIKHWPK
jgi:hypothetical protein